MAVGAVVALSIAESWLATSVGLGLVYLPVVAVAAWMGGLWSAFAVVSAAAFLRGGLGVEAVSRLATETVLLGAVGAAVAKIRVDRRRTERFRDFVHGLLERQARTARRDPLTGLTNRRGFYEQLHVEFARWERGGSQFGVIYLDLDNFKAVNDRFGHERGDELLRDVADRITSNIKETDVPARIGGDEFVIMCWNVTAETLRTIAQRLEARLAGLAGEYEVPEFGVSLGVACFRRPPEEVDEVVRRADAAMYRAKKTDGRSVAVWEAGCERSGDRPAGARASG
jgi:diguanylate cyclase (GGDEF)-like protein